ncbi:MAG: flagellar brake domain-containing protein [Lachnospiraceae bacterium]|nr:flagellar brake domain-containing protein [Lachnospiraceae bacterium]
MISKYVELGDKLELILVEGISGKNNETARRVYSSKINDIISEDRLEILMPMEKTKLVLLPVDAEYDMAIYSKNGLYQCFVRVVDRYKSDNMYLLVVELTSNLRRNQRREYYRFSCALEMCSRSLESEEVEAIEHDEMFNLVPGLPLKRSVIVDISGGGLRFISEQKYEEGSLIYCSYHLLVNGTRKLYELVSKVLEVKPVENRKGVFEHRVQYINISEGIREQIIRYIFQEERKNMKKDRY